MKKLSINKNIFFQYLFYHFMILVIPILILGIIILQFNSQTLMKEIMQSANAKGEIIQLTIDNTLKSIIDNSINLLYNDEVKKYEKNNTVLDDRKIQNELKKYSGYDSSTHLQFFYSENNEKLYSINNALRLNRPVENFKVNNVTLPSFINSLKGNSKITYLEECVVNYNNLTKRYLAIVIFDGGMSRDRFVINFVDIEMLFHGVSSDKLFLFNPEGNLLTTNFENGFQEYSTFDFNGIDQFVKRQDGGKDFVFSLKSSITKLEYIIFMDYNNTFNSLFNSRLMFIFGLILIFAIAAFLIPKVVNIQYKPIKEVTNLIKNKSPEYDFENEYEFNNIKNAIEFIFNQNKSLENKIESHKTAVREFLLSKIIYGEFVSVEEFHSYSAEHGIKFQTESLCIVVFVGPVISYHLMDQLHMIEENGYFKILPEANILIYIMEDLDNKKDVLLRIKKKLEDLAGEKITAGVGKSYSNLKDLFLSFMEAKNAYESSMYAKNEVGMVYYEDIDQEEAKNLKPYNNDIIDMMLYAIEKCDEKKLMDSVSRLKEQTESYLHSPLTIKSIMYEIISRIVKMKKSLLNNNSDLSSEIHFTNNLLNTDSIDEFFDGVEAICNDLIRKNRMLNTKTDELIDLITLKIESDFCNPNYSLQMIADHFNMTPTNLSKYFKAKKGMNIKDYISILETKRAKELLLNSDLPVSDIAYAVGQCDPSNFIKKFKKNTGLTPGEFKALYKD